MTFVDDHIVWMRTQDLGILPMGERSITFQPSTRPGLSNPCVPAGIPEHTPPELRLWFESELPYHTLGCTPLARTFVEGSFATPTMEVLTYEAAPDSFAELQAAKRFPNRPMPFYIDHEWSIVVETEGERAGWLFWYDWIDTDDSAGPIAASLSQYLRAIRGFSELGMLVPGTSDVPFADDHGGGPTIWPPDDAPGPMFGQPTTHIGQYRSTNGTPIAESMTDLFPYWTPVH